MIGEAVVEDEVARERFACDVLQCKGACCTLPGGRGAPLEDDEVREIEKAFPEAKRYLSPEHLRAIQENGMVEGVPGSFATVCIDYRDCVFVYYEGEVARCALERAYVEGKTKWRKPISCHLFPIRVSKGYSDRLRYEQITECKPGRRKGKADSVPLYEYLKEPLVRKYGEAWYENFRRECERRDGA